MSSVYFRSIWNTNNLFIKNGAINTPSYNTIDQNNLIAEYGQILYNSTTNTVKFFSNTGVWSEIGSIPTNNLTIGNLNFNNNTISSTTGDIILYPNSTIVKITGTLNMQTNNIINVGTINTLALPTSTFVGIDDSQVLTNKTINGSQLVNNSVSLAKMSTLTANTIIGNNTGVSATPIALDVSQVRDLLSISLVDNVSINSWTGSSNIVTLGTIPNLNCNSLRVNTGLNMNSRAITSCLSINGYSIPNSTFVGINDTQTLTNKTINGTQIQGKSIFLDRLTNTPTNTLLGNNSGSNNNPIAILAVNVKTMLDLAGSNLGDQNLIGDVTSTGGTTLTTTISSGVVTLTKMANLAANSIIGNNTGVSATPIALDVSQVRSLLSVNLVENQSLSSWTGNNAITMVGNVASGNLVAGFGTINCGAITSDSITAKTTNLLLNGVGGNFANVATNNASFLVSSNVANQESYIGINGPTITNNRHIACYQNGIYRCSFGLSGIQYFYVSDTVANLELFRVNMGGGNNCILFPTYSTNGILRIDSGTVTVDSNFTTGSNTINVDTIIAKTTNSNLYLHPNGTGTVVTNSPVIYIASNRVDSDSAFSIDGPTVTNSRYIACYQNGVYKLGFGLQSSNHFFIWDNVNGRDLFRASILNGNISFPTYSTNGILRIDSGTVTVDTNFTTSTNTINVNRIKSISGSLTIGAGDGLTGVIIDDYKLDIKSRVANVATYIVLDGTSIADMRFIVCSHNEINRCWFGLRGTSEYFIRDIPNNKDVFRAKLDNSALCIVFPTYSTTGTLQMSAGSVVSNTSDRRLKQNEEVLTPSVSLQQILNLQPKKYRWNSDINRTQLGFIAQDVETVIPDAIDGKKYEYEFVRDGAGSGVDGTVRVDEDGNPVLDYTRPRYRGLDQCAILSVLVSAFQELHNNINIKLSSIENRLTALETVINVS